MLLLVSRSAITSADEVESKGKIDRDERKKEKEIQKVAITKALRFLPFLQQRKEEPKQWTFSRMDVRIKKDETVKKEERRSNKNRDDAERGEKEKERENGP
uniref:Uncharacterized protein n=1 Tax=Vespula pensylvanica TaxID=30213 RepID=A0A836UVR5_VESPE|nr:hypothetical protein H0235_014938 [Vespula pensylvanica]